MPANLIQRLAEALRLTMNDYMDDPDCDCTGCVQHRERKAALAAYDAAPQSAAEAWVSVQPEKVHWTEDAACAAEWKRRGWNVIHYGEIP